MANLLPQLTPVSATGRPNDGRRAFVQVRAAVASIPPLTSAVVGADSSKSLTPADAAIFRWFPKDAAP